MMKWLVKSKEKKEPKKKILKKKPNIGETKIKIKFAFFPVKIDDRDVIWLERYIEYYEYRCVYSNTSSYYDKNDWCLLKTTLYDPIRVKQFNKL